MHPVVVLTPHFLCLPLSVVSCRNWFKGPREVLPRLLKMRPVILKQLSCQQGRLAVQKVVIRKGANYVRKRQAVEGDDYMLILHTLVGLKATPNTDAQVRL